MKVKPIRCRTAILSISGLMCEMPINAIIISVGDELTLGRIVDTNAAWLSNELLPLGITVSQHVTVADDLDSITTNLQRCGELADVLLVTGGLGPTEDDLTRHAIANVLGSELQLDQRSLEQIERFFVKLNRKSAPTNRIQAMIPQGCDVIDNPVGTAPGMITQIGRVAAYFLPGVPAEMKQMFADTVKPKLMQLAKQLGTRQIVVSRSLHAVGTGESNIAEMLGDTMARGKNPIVNCTVTSGIISVRIDARADDKHTAQQLIIPVEQEVRQKLGDYVFGCDDDTLAGVVGGLLGRKGKSLAVAESCTGGLLAKNITDISGASEYFKCGWVTYSNAAKIELLQVAPETIEQYGAVSEQVAKQLAYNAMNLADADYALAVTGIAGPTGGSVDKPVGLVYIGLADKSNVTVTRNQFVGGRQKIRRYTVVSALNMLRKKLA